MNQNSIPVLYFDIVRDVLANFDRKNLCQMQIVNKRLNFIIEKEFNNSPPYLLLPQLQYSNNRWTINVGNNLAFPVNLKVLQKIIVSKFIRFQYLHVVSDEHFHPMQLLTMSHVWENGEVRANWECVHNFCPTEEFNRSFINCTELYMNGCNATSILQEIDFGTYRSLQLWDKEYDPISQEITWTKMNDFLFRPVESLNSRNFIYISTDRPPIREKMMEFINSVNERYDSSGGTLNFKFYWYAEFAGVCPKFKWRIDCAKQYLGSYSNPDRCIISFSE